MASALSKNWDDSSAVNNPLVGIVILNWNNAEETLRCLESVFQQTYSNYFVLVVDNGSLENPLDAFQARYPGIIPIRSDRNLGFTGGCNLGMRKSLQLNASYVWLLNSDAVAAPDCLEKLVTIAQAHPDIGLLSPAIYSIIVPDSLVYCGGFYDRKIIAEFSFTKFTDLREWESKHPERITLWGTALLVTRTLIEVVGYFDDRFFAYYEDVDYSFRSTERGFGNKIVPDARVFHDNSDYKNKAHYFYYMTRNRYLLLIKHSKSWRERYSLFWRLLGNAGVRSRRFRHSNSIEIADAILDGLWSAIQGYYGNFQQTPKMPRMLRHIVTWHPYFWSSLMLGKIPAVINRLQQKEYDSSS